MVEELFKELALIEEVEAIALGGSRSGEVFDEKSDYDVYLYCTGPVDEAKRRAILEKYCSVMEIGNHFWELEDNCTLNNGIDIDILYRNIDDFSNEVASVVEECIAHNGYTTCMWHNLNTCKIIYDRDGRLAQTKERFNVAYPQELKKNIISNNMRLLTDNLPSYDAQIRKAAKRGDLNSINHRVAGFLESYFDVIFALNERTHPGEKRLMQLAKSTCKFIPDNFETNLNKLFKDMFNAPELIAGDLENIITELKKILN